MKLINLAFFLCIGITLTCILAGIEWTLLRAVLCYTPVFVVIIYNQYKYGEFTKPEKRENLFPIEPVFTNKPFNIEIVKGDITKLGFDVVVNAANKDLLRGGGVCGSIYKAAEVDGVDKLSEWIEKAKPYGIHVGEAIVSPGFNCAKYIVHAVGPIYKNHTPEEAKRLLRLAYINSLNGFHYDGIDNDVKTIAFPLISSGIYGYPLKEAIEVALSALEDAQADYTGPLETVTIVCFSQEDYNLTVAANEKLLS